MTEVIGWFLFLELLILAIFYCVLAHLECSRRGFGNRSERNKMGSSGAGFLRDALADSAGTQAMAVLSAERTEGTRCFKAGHAIYIILNIFVYKSVLGSFPLINPRRSCAIFLNALSSENPHTGRHVDVWCGPVNRSGERARQSSPGSRCHDWIQELPSRPGWTPGEWQRTCPRSHRDLTPLRISLFGSLRKWTSWLKSLLCPSVRPVAVISSDKCLKWSAFSRCLVHIFVKLWGCFVFAPSLTPPFFFLLSNWHIKTEIWLCSWILS